MIIEFILAFGATIIAAVSQLFLKSSADQKHRSFIKKFLNFKVIFAYGLLFLSTVFNVFAYRTLSLKYQPMIDSTGLIWVAILAAVFINEKPSKIKIISILVTLAGVVIYCL